jgi:hypothetical protein
MIPEKGFVLPCSSYEMCSLIFSRFSQIFNISAASYSEWTVLSTSYLENTHVLTSLLPNPNSLSSYIFHSRRANCAPGQNYALAIFNLRSAHSLYMLLYFLLCMFFTLTPWQWRLFCFNQYHISVGLEEKVTRNRCLITFKVRRPELPINLHR